MERKKKITVRSYKSQSLLCRLISSIFLSRIKCFDVYWPANIGRKKQYEGSSQIRANTVLLVISFVPVRGEIEKMRIDHGKTIRERNEKKCNMGLDVNIGATQNEHIKFTISFLNKDGERGREIAQSSRNVKPRPD